ncbi:MAG: hypothetical protein N4A45_08610 [Flavobacteriales bacterium]|nr:hypothetical protein [Flavobacteriales bacterium]
MFRVLLVLSLLSINFVYAQNFSEQYIKKLSPTWDFEITDSLQRTISPVLDSFYIKSSGVGFWEIQKKLRKKECFEELERFNKVLNYEQDFNTSEFDFVLLKMGLSNFALYQNQKIQYYQIQGNKIEESDLKEKYRSNKKFIAILNIIKEDRKDELVRLAKKQNADARFIEKNYSLQLDILFYKNGKLDLIYYHI